MKRDAVISDCGRYRYRLYREWAPSSRMPILWVMLNPSTADANIDDATIRRCIAFSASWGFDSMWVGNLYAYRSTDPDVLKTVSADEARGPLHAHHMNQMIAESAKVVCGWGKPGGSGIPKWLWSPGGLWCLGKTKHGAPKHPLYIKGDTPLIEFNR